ncbi:tetracycline resistance TCR1 [Fusarium pseudoanthophilum]|uniref:Tetracycline resistance TCR1 n=1 Tax=Fusarium pseudoanthophilum TaxID=48495 RepID=A0A8H5PER2_9HYPO|nr:tetracycline resistance TCR1 [Fusarium pseudoanthophilum]
MARSRQMTAANREAAGRNERPLPPFPAKQMFVLDFNITDDSNKISVYAGMVTSAFTLAEFSTGVLWGRLSDKIGRKPVLLFGLLGTALSVLVFGFAPSLPVALFARALGGLLNGNIGVLQTTVAELVTVKEHQPRAYTIMPMVWCIGSIVGPMIGGALARPCISYPEIFARGTIWDRYPYLLPNLFSAATVFFGVIIGLLFLDETHAEKKSQRDRGREIGDYLASWFGGVASCNGRGRSPEKQALLDGKQNAQYLSTSVRPGSAHSDEALPAYRSQENSPRLAPQPDTQSLNEAPLEPIVVRKSKTFTKPVIMNIISYGILAFHTMTFDQLFPVFLSTKRPEHPVHDLPFKFTDGFGLETKMIGVIMSVQGLYSLFSNYLIVPPVTRRLGSLRLFRILAFSYFALYLVTPYLVLLPESMRMPAIYLLVIWKCTFSTMAYPSNAILLANSAPSKQVLGTINGIAASTASLCRALGPTLSGLLYSWGLQTGYSGLAWWFSGLITIVGAYLSSQITEGGPQDDVLPEEDPLLDEGLFTDYDEEESV